MRKTKNFVRTKWFPSIALSLVALVFMASGSNLENCSIVHASDTVPSDYCFQMDIDITYTGSPTLTNQSFRIPINASGLIAGNQMDARAWDILPIQGSLSNEVQILAEDLDSTSAAFWVNLPSIVQNQTKTVRFYMGSDEQKRNQGVIMTGLDTMTVTDSVLMDISDNLDIKVEIELLDATAQDGPLLTHYNTGGGDGYRFLLLDDAGTLKLRAQADTVTCDLTWDSAWTNTNQQFDMRFTAAAGDDLFIDRNGVNAVACDTDLASITPPAGSPSLESGTGLANLIVRDIALVDAGAITGKWGFDSGYITEDSAANPVYGGTIQDYGVNDLDFKYLFTRDQSNITGVVGAVQLTSAADEISLDETTTDILGSPFGGDLENTGAAETDNNLFFVLWVQGIVTGSDAAIPEEMGYVIALSGLGMILMLVVFKTTNYVPLALFVAGIPPGYGTLKNWVEPWWMILWVILVVGSWLSVRQSEQA